MRLCQGCTAGFYPTGGNCGLGYDFHEKKQSGRLVLRRRSAGEIYNITKMSNVPPHACKKRHKPLSSRLACFVLRHGKHSNSGESNSFLFEKNKKPKKQALLTDNEKFSAYRESHLINADEEADGEDVICCPKCKGIFYVNRVRVPPTPKIPGLKNVDAQQKAATRYWQSYLRSTSNSWINFNTDSVYCY